MDYKRVFCTWLSIVVCAIFLLIVASVVLDPINAIGFPLIRGFNNNKYAQDQYMDVYKPYEFARKEADILFIGTSRVYRGIKPTFEGFPEERVYNFGLSSLSLDHMQSYLTFTYKIHQPKKLFIGLDIFNFSKTNFKNRHEGFSDERLNKITGLYNSYYATKDTMQLNKVVLKNTLIESYKDSLANSKFMNGWYIREADAPPIVAEGYYYNLNSYIDKYRRFEYTDEAIDCLEKIVNEAKKRKIDVYVFFNPLNADIRSIFYLCGQGEMLDAIKKEIVYRIGILYDFNFNNLYTENRELYYDCSHYSPEMGELIKADIMGGRDTERMHILSVNNVNQFLEDDLLAYKKWARKNKDFLDEMGYRISSNSKISVGELKSVLNF